MKFMEYALKEAQKAFNDDEIPVGCIIVKDEKIIASEHNTVEINKDCTCHAEMNAIKSALKIINEKNLIDCEMYVTLEPCPMCAGAILNSKIKRLYIGASEPKSGCCGSVINLFDCKFNHKPEIYYGINEDECSSLLKKFFKDKR